LSVNAAISTRLYATIGSTPSQWSGETTIAGSRMASEYASVAFSG